MFRDIPDMIWRSERPHHHGGPSQPTADGAGLTVGPKRDATRPAKPRVASASLRGVFSRVAAAGIACTGAVGPDR